MYPKNAGRRRSRFDLRTHSGRLHLRPRALRPALATTLAAASRAASASAILSFTARSSASQCDDKQRTIVGLKGQWL